MLDATSPFHQHRWLEERRIVSTTYSASRASFAQDSSLLAMNFTSWMIRSWSARQTMKLQGPGVSIHMYCTVCIYIPVFYIYTCMCTYIHGSRPFRWLNLKTHIFLEIVSSVCSYLQCDGGTCTYTYCICMGLEGLFLVHILDLQNQHGLASFPGLYAQLLSLAVRKAGGRPRCVSHMNRATTIIKCHPFKTMTP